MACTPRAAWSHRRLRAAASPAPPVPPLTGAQPSLVRRPVLPHVLYEDGVHGLQAAPGGPCSPGTEHQHGRAPPATRSTLGPSQCPPPLAKPPLGSPARSWDLRTTGPAPGKAPRLTAAPPPSTHLPQPWLFPRVAAATVLRKSESRRVPEGGGAGGAVEGRQRDGATEGCC